ncbi:SET domain-containing protein [Microthyrium microscopicum]|uniref:SET domain-containing protein n=1 Tax=Microthyrium microscopicum TaxID=703497 RepID=A0A6A6UHI4_9PEZI|nr:SET domain-containing protein [Microthyrium microscopicum]
MIRSGKSSSSPWLTLPPDAFHAWATLNGISLSEVAVAIPASISNSGSASQDGSEHADPASSIKGYGLVASQDIKSHDTPLLSVPRDMVLSERRVRELASGDVRLAELLKACGSYATSSRIVIMIFLLYQITIVNPNIKTKIGLQTPFIEYIKFMPLPQLTTLLSEDELLLFEGTTIVPATRVKLNKLLAEYTTLRQATKSISWLAPTWWGFESPPVPIELSVAMSGLEIDVEEEFANSDPLITLEDWILLDAMYRSRALEWPGEGEAMVPAIDMANHTVPANAEFQVMPGGDGALLAKDDTPIKSGDEILISYGDHKSTLEILFSYGFLPDYEPTAKSILLSLPPPGEDPLGPPKAFIAQKENFAPGIRIHEEQGEIKWDSEVLWLMILNEEDGLDFKVAYGPDRERELDMTWKDEVVRLGVMKDLLMQDSMAELFELRATVLVLGQIERQLERLTGGSGVDSNDGVEVSKDLCVVAEKLREMETRLLVEARDQLDTQKSKLVQSETVQSYFRSIQHPIEDTIESNDNEDGEEEDFT